MPSCSKKFCVFGFRATCGVFPSSTVSLFFDSWLVEPAIRKTTINYMLLSSKTKRSSQLVINFPKVLQAKKNNKPHGKITGATKMRLYSTFHGHTKPPNPNKNHRPYPSKLWNPGNFHKNLRPSPCGIHDPSFRTIKPPSLVHPEA